MDQRTNPWLWLKDDLGKKKEKQKKKRKEDTKQKKGRGLGTILKLIKKAKTKIKQQELINFQSSINFKKTCSFDLSNRFSLNLKSDSWNFWKKSRSRVSRPTETKFEPNVGPQSSYENMNFLHEVTATINLNPLIPGGNKKVTHT